MSLITIVDSSDNVIGSEERSIVYQKGLYHRLVRVLLFNNKGEVLLQWRSATEDTFPNTWDQSAGGHVDANEDYEIVAYRELEEELGVKDVKLTLLGKFYTEGNIGEKIIKRFNTIFKADYTGDFILQEEEVEKVKWFSKEELFKEIEIHPENFTDGLKSILRDYKDVI
jgi:isopentenyldiphosphate isomerase